MADLYMAIKKELDTPTVDINHEEKMKNLEELLLSDSDPRATLVEVSGALITEEMQSMVNTYMATVNEYVVEAVKLKADVTGVRKIEIADGGTLAFPSDHDLFNDVAFADFMRNHSGLSKMDDLFWHTGWLVKDQLIELAIRFFSGTLDCSFDEAMLGMPQFKEFSKRCGEVVQPIKIEDLCEIFKQVSRRCVFDYFGIGELERGVVEKLCRTHGFGHPGGIQLSRVTLSAIS